MAKYQAMTQEWLDAWKQKISESKEYKEIAKNWEGSVSIIVNPDPENKGLRL
jgi:ABC-type amino acid transport substrate-binding protein